MGIYHFFKRLRNTEPFVNSGERTKPAIEGVEGSNHIGPKEAAMALKPIKTESAPAAIGPYSQGMTAGPWLFVSGQLGLDPESGALVGTDLVSQARQALQNLLQILVSAGAGLDQVVAVEVFLTDIGRFAEFNQVYETFFSDHRPARAVVGVAGLPKDALVEVKCMAYTANE
jgi:2-iminobutanoate/2-iminopropanoate deaminase